MPSKKSGANGDCRENKTLVRRLFAIFNSGDYSKVTNIIDRNFKESDPNIGKQAGTGATAVAA